LDLRTKYKVKGIGSEHTIDSVVSIYYDKAAGKIEKVEDRWNNELPVGAFKNVSSFHQLLSPRWWLRFAENRTFWAWSFLWYTRLWMVCRSCIIQPGLMVDDEGRFDTQMCG